MPNHIILTAGRTIAASEIFPHNPNHDYVLISWEEFRN
jgi:hypothetical protein